MSIGKLPPLATPEWEELKKKILDGQADSLWQSLGFGSKPRFMEALRRRGIKVSELPIQAALVEPSAQPETLSSLEQSVLDIVQKGAVSVGEISRQVDRSSETVIKTIDLLRAKHYEVILDEVRHEVSIPHIPLTEFKPTEFKYYRKKYIIGLVGDTQIGSKYQQMTALYDAYSIFDSRLVDFILHAGDVLDGIDMYRGHRDELFLYDAEQQRKYAIEQYPKSKRGTKTYLIGGQHDYCYMKQNGYNILEHLCEERKDLVYKGFYSAEFNIKGLRIGLEHPGGGINYALSYAIQKFMEDVGGYVLTRVRNKPDELKQLPIAVFFGHYHKMIHLPSYMGIDAVGLPCFQARTKYLQQKRHHPDVGCAIAEIWLNENNNLGSVKVEFIIMNDRIKENDN